MNEFTASPGWPPGGGITAALARATDWSSTPLGDESGWPPGFRTAVELCLASAFPCFVSWGEGLVQIYNDAAIPLVGERHPEAFARPLSEFWPYAWEVIRPLVAEVTERGETVSREDFAVRSTGGDQKDERYTFSCSPLRDATGKVAGLFSTVIQTTRRVRAEGNLRERDNEARGAFLLALADRLRPLGDPEAIMEAGSEMVRGHLGLASASVGAPGAADGDGTTAARPGPGAASAPPPAGGRDVFVEGAPGGPPARAAIPLHKAGRLAAWFHAVDTGPRAWRPAERVLLRDAAERIWEAAEHARAEAMAREGQRRLRSLVEGIPQLVWRASEGGEWTWSSPQWRAYTGLPEAEALGHGWLAALHPEDREAAMAAWRQSETSQGFEAEFRILRRGDMCYRWFQTRATPVRDENGTVVEWLGTSTDVDELRRMGQHQRLLLGELQHRVRNTLSVIRSIIRRTVQASGNLDDLAMHLDGRIDAFSRVQAAVTRNPERGIDLAQLVADELLAFSAREGRQVRIEGPAVTLRPKAAETMALAIHELATNAIKFGALSAPQGRVDVDWEARLAGETPRLIFCWRESGLGAVGLPEHHGFGTEMFERTLPYELNAEVRHDFVQDGLRCTISLPLSDRLVKEETLAALGLAG